MADPVTTTPVAPSPASQPAAPPAAEPAPVTTTPAAQPTPSQAAPAPVVTTPAEPAPAAQPAAPAPTLLEKFDAEKAAATTLPAVAEAAEAAKTAPAPLTAAQAAPPAPKPAEIAKPGEAPPAQAAQAAPTAPVEYKYTLPETITMDDALRSEVHTAFDNFRANPAEGAQQLVNLHEKQMTEFAQAMAKRQVDVWNETKQGWAKKVLADPELGGSGYQTTMGAVARMRDLFVNEKNRAEFEDMIRTTGVGDHPAFLRMLHQAARYFDEPTLPPPNPRPAPGNGQRPSRRLRDVYDHPRSSPEGRS
jgi:hypothetical protein